MSEPNKSRRQIVIFLLLLFALSAVFYCLILIAHKLEAGKGLYVSGLMWCPSFAAVVTIKLSGRKLSELGWKWPQTRYAIASWFIPLLYATLGYLIIYVQSIFTPLTHNSGHTAWFFDEFGVVLPLVTIAFPIFFCSRRGELKSIVRQSAQETGSAVPAGVR